MALELVTWRDAHYAKDEADLVWDEDDYLVLTTGWVTEEVHGLDREPAVLWLRIEGERTPDAPRCITMIPMSVVIARKELRTLADWEDA